MSSTICSANKESRVEAAVLRLDQIRNKAKLKKAKDVHSLRPEREELNLENKVYIEKLEDSKDKMLVKEVG